MNPTILIIDDSFFLLTLSWLGNHICASICNTEFLIYSFTLQAQGEITLMTWQWLHQTVLSDLAKLVLFFTEHFKLANLHSSLLILTSAELPFNLRLIITNCCKNIFSSCGIFISDQTCLCSHQGVCGDYTHRVRKHCFFSTTTSSSLDTTIVLQLLLLWHKMNLYCCSSYSV